MRSTSPRTALAVAAALSLVPILAGAQPPSEDATRIEKREVLVFRTATDEVVEIAASPRPRGYLGVDLLDLTPELREHFGVPRDRGVLVSRVLEDSPAARRGLRPGDIVTAADGQPLPSGLRLAKLVADAGENRVLDLECWRDRGRLSLQVPVEIRQRARFDVAPLIQRRLHLDGPHVIRLHSGHQGEAEDERVELTWVGDAVGELEDSLSQTVFLEQLEAMRVERAALREHIERLEQRLAELETELHRLDD